MKKLALLAALTAALQTSAQPVDPTKPKFTSVKLTATSGSIALRLKAGTYICLDDPTCAALFSYQVASGNLQTAIGFSTNQGAGQNAFAASTNGARFDFGGGATDYCTSDGTTVTFAGTLASAGFSSSNDINATGAGGFLASGTGGNHYVASSTSAANASTTVPAMSIYPTAALDATDQVFCVETQNQGANLFCVDHTGITIERMGTSTGYANVLGLANATTADVTSSGASNLISYTLPANALITTNRCLRIKGWGTALNNANAKTVALDFGSQTIISKILTPSIASTTWSFQATVCRSGASTQDIYAEAFNPMGTTVSSVDANTVLYQAARTAGTQTETATITIKGKTTTATTTDVTMDGLTVEFM